MCIWILGLILGFRYVYTYIIYTSTIVFYVFPVKHYASTTSEKLSQIRKLYEPKKYDAAPVHDIFNKYFHRNIEDLNSTLPYICAIGIEPNPNHEQKLKSIKTYLAILPQLSIHIK